METKDFALRITGFIFFVVAVLHVLRIATEVPILIAGWLMPIWVNWMGFVATGIISGWLWWLSFHKSDDSSQYLKDRNKYY
jgi:hypothetical protein